jgi:hypothetical protein
MTHVREISALTYMLGSKSCKRKNESIDEVIIDIAVANPFKILSAYLMTAATINPPTAYITRDQSHLITMALPVILLL